MTDLEKAKKIFNDANGEYSLVLCKGDDVFTSSGHGIKTLVSLVEGDKDYSEYSACDKIVGRAAAFMYVLLGVSNVHSSVMAKLAIQILDRAEINYSADSFVDGIQNRSKTGSCPMETAVIRSGSPVKALEDIKNQMKALGIC